MPDTFFGLNTALRGLEAQQIAMDVTSHNIANASTPGYSRQTASLETTDPYAPPSMQMPATGQIGTGVTVGTIGRAHDNFVQQQILYQNGVLAQQQTQSDTLSSIEGVFNDPSDGGFSNLLNTYFAAWQQLANNPTDGPARASVAARGAALAAGFNTASNALQSIQRDEDQQVGGLVKQVNDLVGQIAALNEQITSVNAVGQQPNDLKDKRDTLINQLSQLVDIQYTEMPNGAANISLAGGGALVQGIATHQLQTAADANNPQFTGVVLQGQTQQLQNLGGKLGGVITARDVTLGNRINALNTLANNVMSAVNAIHASGYDNNGNPGVPFFVGTSAATMAVNPAISADPNKIAAASAPNQPGDGSIALQVAQLQENPPAGQTQTLQGQYSSIIAQLGIDAQQAQADSKTTQQALQNLNAQQDSVSAVSLNEEASNLMRYQHAYEAAARVMTILDQSIGDMIKQLGG